MADVFISYASADRAVAERLSKAIEKHGLTVWWDRHIKGGAEFSRDIEQQLDGAKHVLVLWSKEAVNSRWVRDEAGVAADSHRLVAATIDGTPAPLGFRQFQTIDLARWSSRGAAIPRDLAEALDVEPEANDAPGAPRRRVPKAAIIGALLVAMGGGVALLQPAPFDRWLSGETQDDGLALAIMPFVTEGGRDTQYLGAGLAGALADSLSPLSGLQITASTSTQAIARKGLTAKGIGRELGVTHLVEGSVQRSANHYAISVRLVEAGTSEQIWTRKFEGSTEALQLLKSRMARELAAAIRARLGAGEGEIAERRNVDPRAYEAYLRAIERVSVREDREARVEAIKQFRLAATIEPDFAEAHAGHAYLLALSVPRHLGTTWEELITRQRRATERALELDPDNELALIARSTALKNFEGDSDKSWAIDRMVLEKSPNFGPAHYSMAATLWMRGRAREALDHLDRAIERDPFDNLLRFYRAKILYSLGDYESVRLAADQCREQCAAMGYFWYLALAGFGTAADYREDIQAVTARGRAEGVPNDVLKESEEFAEALIFARRPKGLTIEEGPYIEFADAALAARTNGFEDGLRIARLAAQYQHSDSVLDILNDGRVTFTPEQRADPRYHQLFRHPKLAKIAAARRKEGVTGGLPVFPVRPYAGS